jgi:hypothetical protein
LGLKLASITSTSADVCKTDTEKDQAVLIMQVVWKETTSNELVHRIREEAMHDLFRTGKTPYDDVVFFSKVNALKECGLGRGSS